MLTLGPRQHLVLSWGRLPVRAAISWALSSLNHVVSHLKMSRSTDCAHTDKGEPIMVARQQKYAFKVQGAHARQRPQTSTVHWTTVRVLRWPQGSHHVVVHGQRELVAVREHGPEGRGDQPLPLPRLLPALRVVLRRTERGNLHGRKLATLQHLYLLLQATIQTGDRDGSTPHVIEL